MRAAMRTKTATALIVAAMIGLVVAGCGGSDRQATGGGTTVTHVLGATTVGGVPQRVVALGNQWLDSVQALGVTPVGYVDTVAAIAGGPPPWEPKTLAGVKALDTQGDLVEQIAALNPDLILAPAFFVDRPMYDKLSEIAPTIVSLTHAAIDPWDREVAALGRVLHRGAQADAVIAALNGRIAAVARCHPTLRGRTFVSAWVSGPSQIMAVNDPNDGAVQLFTRLGLSIPAPLQAEHGNGGRVALSSERIDELDADLLTVMAASGVDRQFAALPGYSALTAVHRGSVVYLDPAAGAGLNQPTALNLPYLLDKLEPGFTAAAA